MRSMIESSKIIGYEILHPVSFSTEDLTTFNDHHLFSYRRQTRDQLMNQPRVIQPRG